MLLLKGRTGSVNVYVYIPQRAAHKISELNLFLYFLISGVSDPISCDVGVTLTFTCDSRLLGPEPPAPKPKVKKDLCFCWRGMKPICDEGDIRDEDEAVDVLEGLTRGPPTLPPSPFTACRYWKEEKTNNINVRIRNLTVECCYSWITINNDLWKQQW